VAQKVGLRAFLDFSPGPNCHAARYPADVRVPRVDSAIDDRDAHASPGTAGKWEGVSG